MVEWDLERLSAPMTIGLVLFSLGAAIETCECCVIGCDPPIIGGLGC